jgi:hypothetical protein
LLAQLAAFFQTGRLVLMGLTLFFRRADFMNTILQKLFLKRLDSQTADEKEDYQKLD